jgi:hypothetical protein
MASGKFSHEEDTGLEPTPFSESSKLWSDYLRNATGNKPGFPPNYFYTASTAPTLLSNIEDPKMGKIKVPRSSMPAPKMIQVLKPAEDLMMTPTSIPAKDFFTAGARLSQKRDR